MKITLSKAQWEMIGNKTGWIKEAQKMKFEGYRPSEEEAKTPEYQEKIKSYVGKNGLCPVCGDKIEIIGLTTDNRLIGVCGDAFWLKQWTSK